MSLTPKTSQKKYYYITLYSITVFAKYVEKLAPEAIFFTASLVALGTSILSKVNIYFCQTHAIHGKQVAEIHICSVI